MVGWWVALGVLGLVVVHADDQVATPNTLVDSVPSKLMAGTFGFGPHEYFEIEERARGPIRARF